jgi:hypothetical protein
VFWNKLNASDARRGGLQALKIPLSDCDTKNLVYLCGCSRCGKYYEGETGDSFNRQCSKHRSQPSDLEKFKRDGHVKDWSEVRRHFVEHKHQDCFWVMAPLEVLRPDAPERLHKKREQAWIKCLKPVLNVKLTRLTNDHQRRDSRADSPSPGRSPVGSPALRRKLGLAPSTKKD